MRTIKTKVYTIKELRRPAFEKAHQDYCESLTDIPWQEECIDSLKTLFEKCSGVELKDWNRGNGLTVRFSQDGTEELSGGRAMAWLENNLPHGLRAPWGLNKSDGNLHQNHDGKWCRWYAPGTIKSCPLTGICFDEYYLDYLTKSLREGDTLREAFEGLAGKCAEMLESEDEYQRTEESFRDHAEANEYEFKFNGERI